ncbi:hypothetical protein [Ascidiimonas aurantiaca]|uniref:hypothetical protein n=1 Tax=Ascidiimonas aurantiaca TaxID=1685432 RepID=UPI0030EBA3F2
MKQISNFGKALNKQTQKEIIAGCSCGHICDQYNGPLEVTCEQYFNLPPEFQQCVDVSADCFPL